jgi:ribosomal protein L11 methyltransferase
MSVSIGEIDCWKVRAVLPKPAADALSAALEAMAPVPIVTAFETGERNLWEVEAFFVNEPAEHELPKLEGAKLRPVPVPKSDWVAIALDGLPPVRTARFFIHGKHAAKSRPANMIGLEIEASTAFGTGHHGTTKGCLEAYETLLRQNRFSNALDLGCGSGILGIAYAKTMHARAIAADIDPVARAKADENAKRNECAMRIRCIAANGFAHTAIKANAPYDLIFANILARPLMNLMGGIAAHLSRKGHVILSGLLTHQEAAIRDRATAHGLVFQSRRRLEGWVTLTFFRP